MAVRIEWEHIKGGEEQDPIKLGKVVSGDDAGENPEEGNKADADDTETVVGADGVEYEYVDITSPKSNIFKTIANFLSEYSIIIGIIVFAVVLTVLLNLRAHMGTLFLAVAFGLIAAFMVFLIYQAWVKKKDAERELMRARALYDSVKKKKGIEDDEQ